MFFILSYWTGLALILILNFVFQMKFINAMSNFVNFDIWQGKIASLNSHHILVTLLSNSHSYLTDCISIKLNWLPKETKIPLWEFSNIFRLSNRVGAWIIHVLKVQRYEILCWCVLQISNIFFNPGTRRVCHCLLVPSWTKSPSN